MKAIIGLCLFVFSFCDTFAQTAERPSRSVTDPGIITTRQNITPAGVQSIFDGRVYGVAFGSTSNDIWTLTARGRSGGTQAFQLDWANNQVLSRIAVAEAPGLQGIVFDAASNAPLISATLSRPAPKGTTRLLTVANNATKVIADELGNYIAGALAVAPKPNAQGQRLAVVPLIYNNQLAVIDLATSKLLGKIETGIAPFGAVINATGTVAYVTNWGGRVPKPGELTAPTGLDPQADQVIVDVPDAVPTETLNRIVWRQVRGAKVPYPRIRQSVFAPLAVETEDEERETSRRP